MATRTYSPDEIAAYLDDPIAVEDHDLADISVCISIIGRYEPDEKEHDPEMVEAAAESLFSFLGDFGVVVDSYTIR